MVLILPKFFDIGDVKYQAANAARLVGNESGKAKGLAKLQSLQAFGDGADAERLNFQRQLPG
jgi:hypothetical protein